jgi:hypothetical protein
VKIGGSLLAEGVEETELASDIERIASSHNLVIVHGGGKDVTRICERIGKKPIFVTSPEGFRSRYTDLETLEIYVMVMAGKVNKELVAYLRRRGLNAIGLSGVDAGILKAERKKKLVIIDERGRKRIIEGLPISEEVIEFVYRFTEKGETYEVLCRLTLLYRRDSRDYSVILKCKPTYPGMPYYTLEYTAKTIRRIVLEWVRVKERIIGSV